VTGSVVRNPQTAGRHPRSHDADLLETIIAATRRIVEVRQAAEPLAVLKERAAGMAARAGRFHAALARAGRITVIAECKRRSTFFDGALEHVKAVRAAVDVPLLRKDFIVSEYQLLEAKTAGADAVLLIVAALRPAELKVLHDHARRYGLDVLVEVHDARELAIAVDAGGRIIGVNNRSLRTLEVDLHASDELIAGMPADVIAVSESGLRTSEDLVRLRNLGYRAFLIGEAFMTAADPGSALESLLASAALGTKDTEVTKDTEQKAIRGRT